MALTAGAPLPVLVLALKRAGWGSLATETMRGLRLVLDGLAVLLDARSGAGKVTAPQLAEVTDYSERWVRRNLALLEEAGIIEWSRGGIVQGSPTPSWVRVSKRTLLDLVQLARPEQSERKLEQQRETRRRVARLRTSYTQRPGKTRPRNGPRARRAGHHAELLSALPPNGEVSRAPASAGGAGKDKKDDAPASRSTIAARMAELKAITAANRGRGPGKSAATRGGGTG